MDLGLVMFQVINIVLVGLTIALPIMALIQMFRQQLATSETVLWVILILFFPLIGSLVFFASYRNRRKRKRKNSELI